MKIFIFLLILNSPFCFYGQSNQGLSFESTSYDFGTISSGTDAVATFNFTNNTSVEIEILKIHGENHCIEIDSSSLKRYAPKEKGLITVTYNTECIGPIRKTLSVFTSVKGNTSTLKLTGKVIENK